MTARAIKRKAKSAGANAGAQKKIRLVWSRPANTVFIAGTFNSWGLTPLSPAGEGTWAVELTLEPGEYQYRFIVDGEWVDDPQATEFIPNIYGGINCVFSISAASAEDSRTGL